MEIKQCQRPSWLLRMLGNLVSKQFALIALTSFAALALGDLTNISVVPADAQKLIASTFASSSRRYEALLAKPMRLEFDIKFRHYLQLHNQRQAALSQGMLLPEHQVFVPAVIRTETTSVKAKIRLKGDFVDHLSGDKWSLRVQVEGNGSILGMKRFSLQDPGVRNHIFEWIMHRALRNEDLISLRYYFVEVVINGESKGIYAAEEHFDKLLVEHNSRREGPIVRFSEEEYRRGISERNRFPWRPTHPNMVGPFEGAEINGFDPKSLFNNDLLATQYVAAIQLLDTFRRGGARVSDVFNVKQLASFFALADVMGASHGNAWFNLRFYYNPTTSRLEPVGYDFAAGQPIRELSSFGALMVIAGAGHILHIRQELWRLLFEDLDFHKEYISALERFSSKSYMDTLLDSLSGELNDNLSIIYKNFPDYVFDSSVFYKNQEYIRTILNPPNALQAYYVGANMDRVHLILVNSQPFPIEVESIVLPDGSTLRSVDPSILPSRSGTSPPILSRVEFVRTTTLADSTKLLEPAAAEWKVAYRLSGSGGSAKHASVLPYPPRLKTFTGENLDTRPANAKQFPFVEVDDAAKILRIRQGSWRVAEDLIFPPGYVVSSGPGVSLDLVASAMIISHSPLMFSGSEEEPIVLHSSDGTGQGLAVLEAGGTSQLEYVYFSGLRNPQRGAWTLTGAVTFYESPVTMTRCQSVRNSCEDGVNIVRSRFTIHDCLFKGSTADALDIDFGQGAIKDTIFEDCGGDCIDVSGTSAEVQDVKVSGAGDKALSAGEGSRVNGSTMLIDRANLGVVSKDQSVVVFADVVVSAKYAVAVFQKKPEFGPATLHIRNLKTSSGYLLEEGSRLLLNGQEMSHNATGVASQLYPESAR